MKKLILLLILLLPVCVYANETTFVWHKMVVYDRNDNVLDNFSGKGLIIETEINSKKYICITIGKESTYEIQIVNTVVDNPAENIKVVMYQGGQTINDKIAVITVFYIYLTDKNKVIPESIRIDVNNSDNVIELSGLIKLDK